MSRETFPETLHPRFRFPTVMDLLALAGVYILLTLLVMVVAFFILAPDASLLELLSGNGQPTPAEQVELGRFTAITYAVIMSLMIAFTLFYRRHRGGTRKTLRVSLKGFDPTLLVVGLVMILASGVVLEPLLELLPMPSPTEYGRGFWTILCLVVLAPVFEEVLCRGVILESARAKYGIFPALFLSAGFFAVLHWNPALAVNAFVVGLILGYIYLVTDSIFSVILLHALNNGLAYLLLMFGLPDVSLRSAIHNPTLYGVIYGICLAIFLASAYRIYRKCVHLQTCAPVLEK